MPPRDGFLEDKVFADDDSVLLGRIQSEPLLCIRGQLRLIGGADTDIEGAIS